MTVGARHARHLTDLRATRPPGGNGPRQRRGADPRDVAGDASEPMSEHLSAAHRGAWDTAFGYVAEASSSNPGGLVVRPCAGRHAAVGYIQAVLDHYRDGNIELGADRHADQR